MLNESLCGVSSIETQMMYLMHIFEFLAVLCVKKLSFKHFKMFEEKILADIVLSALSTFISVSSWTSL